MLLPTRGVRKIIHCDQSKRDIAFFLSFFLSSSFSFLLSPFLAYNARHFSFNVADLLSRVAYSCSDNTQVHDGG